MSKKTKKIVLALKKKEKDDETGTIRAEVMGAIHLIAKGDSGVRKGIV